VAGNPEELEAIWAGQGLLAYVSGENMIRLWNLEVDENYMLTLAEADSSNKLLDDSVTHIS